MSLTYRGLEASRTPADLACLALDRLRFAARRKETYFGPWLLEPWSTGRAARFASCSSVSVSARSVSDVLALATLYGTGRRVELTAADPGLDVLINADIPGCIAPFAHGEMRRLAPLLFDAREGLAAQLHDVHLLRAGMTSGMTNHVLPGRWVLSGPWGVLSVLLVRWVR